MNFRLLLMIINISKLKLVCYMLHCLALETPVGLSYMTHIKYLAQLSVSYIKTEPIYLLETRK